MEWRDQGILLKLQRFGETSAIIEVFTPEHGRHAGVVRGGASRRMAPFLQLGSQLDVQWSARLEDHLGTFRVEPLKTRAAGILHDKVALAGLNALCALLCFTLPEREAHARIYALSLEMMDGLGRDPNWASAYVRWEMALLEDMGFGLDLSCCAVLGGNDDLAYISPRTGRAVSRAAAGDWAERLLPFSPMLIGELGSPRELQDALKVTGHFLHHWLAPALGDRPLPQARGRLVDVLGVDVR